MDQTAWQAAAALLDPVRRALYDYVRHQPLPVTREQAADAQSISRSLAAFHLDKLVEAGLLGTRYEAPADEPRGRGRTPKVYEAAGAGLNLTLPQRRYELIASILTEAIAAQPANAATAACERARMHGEKHGKTLTRHRHRGAVAMLAKTLSELGYEPAQQDTATLVMLNCPFHTLAVSEPALVCALNHAFVDGIISGAGEETLHAELVPRPGGCCVQITADKAP